MYSNGSASNGMGMKTGERLLCYVIDDSEEVRTLLASFLRNRGHEVISFASAEEAASELGANSPHLVFLDWMLPKMHGVELCRRIRSDQSRPQPVIVMITAKTDAASLDQALDAGVDEYIHKPFSLPHLAVHAMIAERRAAEKRALVRKTADLAEHRTYLAALSDSICAGILVIDAETREILECNEFAAAMIGSERADIVGKVCHDFLRIASQEACVLPKRDEQITRCKAILHTTQGDRPVLKNARGVSLGGRTVVVESFLDISDLERAQQELSQYAGRMEQLAELRAQQLLHADRLALLGTMSAGIAHEINNCITMISPNAQMLERYLAHLLPPEETPGVPEWQAARNRIAREGAAESLAAIHGGVKRAMNILANLKNYARRDGDGRSACEIGECIASALQLCHNLLKYGVEVENTLPAGLPPVLAEQQQIEQVIVNLINNAAQAMNGNGRIRLSARVAADTLLLLVEDSGPGIDPANASQIWEPFFTTKARDVGTGLGLPICKGILKDHGGDIRLAESSLGGAGFELELPLYRGDAAASGATAEATGV